jgi:hypothetical protein
MPIPGEWVLSVERTTWKFDSHRHNILTLYPFFKVLITTDIFGQQQEQPESSVARILRIGITGGDCTCQSSEISQRLCLALGD